MTSVPIPRGGDPEYGAIGATIGAASTTIIVPLPSLESSANITNEGDMS